MVVLRVLEGWLWFYSECKEYSSGGIESVMIRIVLVFGSLGIRYVVGSVGIRTEGLYLVWNKGNIGIRVLIVWYVW